MARRYILKALAPGKRENGERKPNNLFSLSSYGMNQDESIIKHSLSIGNTETNSTYGSSISDYYDENSNFSKYADITQGSSQQFVPFFSKSYSQRREYLRQFANNGEIIFVLDTIADDAITFDQNNYFAYLDIDKIKANINKNYPKANDLIDICKSSYEWVYSIFG